MRHLCALLVVGGIAAASAPATAQTLQHSFTAGQELHYRIQFSMSTPYGTWLQGDENIQARVNMVQMMLLTRCVHQPPRGKVQPVTCEIDRAIVGVNSPIEKEKDDAAAISEEYAKDYESITVDLEFTTGGRLKSVDVDGFDKGTAREAEVAEYERMLLQRAYSALEFELPRNGDTKGKAWKVGGHPQAMRLPVTTGTAGGVRVLHEIISSDDTEYVFRTVGEGTVMSGATMEAETNQSVSMMLSGEGHFDHKRGLITKNFQSVQGVMTAQAGVIGTGMHLDQQVMIELVPDFTAILAELNAAEAAKEKPPATRTVLTYEETPKPLDEVLPATPKDEPPAE